MSHRVRKWSLQETFFSHAFQQRVAVPQMLGQQSKHLVETLNLFVERLQSLWPVTAAGEVRARVAEHAGHVKDQFRRRAHAINGAERTKLFRRIAQSFLCAVGERRQKMIQEFSLFFHQMLFRQMLFRIGTNGSFTPPERSSTRLPSSAKPQD